jgi:dTDP-4-amino-4,6-dideoxygalactose transaminase
MSATAAAIVHAGHKPVFVDIEEDGYNLDPRCLKLAISNRTKAIVAADIFGQSANMDQIRKIADEYGLKVISDAAQSPGAVYKCNYAGTMADIGGFSLNYHKHIHCGEGGIALTNDENLAARMRLFRNHGEAVEGFSGSSEYQGIVGHNMRMGELEAAIARVQLRKLETIVSQKSDQGKYLSNSLSGLLGLKVPKVSEHSSHVYYVFALQLEKDLIHVNRSRILDALRAEGLVIGGGYQNLHKLKYFKTICSDAVRLPTAERLHNQDHLGFGFCRYQYNRQNLDEIATAFIKVWDNIGSL